MERYQGKTDTLGQLARHIRNAAAHGRITFSSDSRYLHEVVIAVEDSGDGGESINWRADINGDKLYEFCVKFAMHVREPSAKREFLLSPNSQRANGEVADGVAAEHLKSA